MDPSALFLSGDLSDLTIRVHVGAAGRAIPPPSSPPLGSSSGGGAG
jgi:hypothetical protein